MSPETLTFTASETDLASAAWIFEQMAQSDGSHVDRSRIRRAIDESARFCAEQQPADWWRWIVEAGQSLGRKCRVVDGELPELIQLARDGVVIIIRSRDGVTWHSLTAGRGGKLRFLTPHGQRPRQQLSAGRVTTLIRGEGVDGVVRCVVVEPVSTAGDAPGGDHGAKKPQDRLFTLLRAEKTDIWVVLTFALVSGLLSMTTPLAVEALVNTVAFGRFLQPVIVLSIMLLVFLVFQAVLKTVQTVVVEIIQRRLFARVAADLSFRLPRARMDALGDHYPPELVNRFFDIVTVQKVSAQLLLDGVTLLLSALVGMTVLAFYHPYLLAFDIVLILLMLFTVLVMGRGAVRTSIKESKTKYAMAAWLEDLVRCPTTFRGGGASEFALERSDSLIYDYLTARHKHFKVLIRQVVLMLLIQALASTSLLAIGGWLVISGQLSLGQLVAAELIVAIVVGSFAKFGKHIESFYDLLASVDKLGHLLDLPMERQDGLLTSHGGSGAGLNLLNVSYTLSDGHKILNAVSISIHSGERIALCGCSGSGKSLLLDMLFGLREPTSGVVSLNGIDLRDLRPETLQRRVALARDVEVFDGTVSENVHLERPDINIGDVRSALQLVSLEARLQDLPTGLETHLSSGGAPLTGNQLRRLMIARAIAANPEVLLLDEVLDSMTDPDSEQILQKLIHPDRAWTVVLVTNRSHLAALMTRTVDVTAVRHHSSSFAAPGVN